MQTPHQLQSEFTYKIMCFNDELASEHKRSKRATILRNMTIFISEIFQKFERLPVGHMQEYKQLYKEFLPICIRKMTEFQKNDDVFSSEDFSRMHAIAQSAQFLLSRLTLQKQLRSGKAY